MSTTQKRANFSAKLFGALFLYLVIYFIIVGPNGFANNNIHYAINSIIFIICVIVYANYLRKTNKDEFIVDERDTSIQKQSYGVSLIITLVYVYLICIILWQVFRDNNYIQISWLWFIGYSTFTFAYFITSTIILYHYNKE